MVYGARALRGAGDVPQKHCVIGAGFSGLPVAKKLMELGETFDLLDKNDGVGGLWREGAYETAHIISSKYTTGFPDFPMPKSYPDFPSRDQMRAYFEAYAREFGILEHFEPNSEVSRVRPAPDHRSGGGWIVELEDGRERRYKTVTIANGHHTKPREVSYPGNFTGEEMRSNEYRSPRSFEGKRVLVVGNGNTGCDAAVDAARFGVASDVSMRSGAWFFPRTFMGVPLDQLLHGFPIRGFWVESLVGRLVALLVVGDLRQYGVPKPRFRPFEKHPIINTELLNRVRLGEITVRPGIERFEGKRVHFVDGTSAEYDLVFWAVGYRVDFPMIREEDGLLDWEDGLPVLHSGLIAPKYRGLFFSGLGQARTGGGPLFEAGGYILARMIAFEGRSPGGVLKAIEENSLVRLARRFFGLRMVQKVDVRSMGYTELQRQIKQALRVLDDIGCPDAPSRKGYWEPWTKSHNLLGAGVVSAAH